MTIHTIGHSTRSQEALIELLQGAGVALNGSTDAALSAARSYLEREVRDLQVVCWIGPPMGFDPDSGMDTSLHTLEEDGAPPVEYSTDPGMQSISSPPLAMDRADAPTP